ncbi:hypothetical protein R1flu_009108 [Riccia fluitans]|uniref:U-box domain-containing protein n=1 Tax=Riccia fluitans TaxID=41844 RepID=A0ABD1Z1L8_9MARC
MNRINKAELGSDASPGGSEMQNEVLDGCRRTNNFQERMQELYSVHNSDSAAARSQIQGLLQPLVSRMSVQDEKLQMLISYVESEASQHKTTESTDIQKFFADVITAVEQLQNAPVEQPQNEYQLEELMYDPIYMNDLMWDPVKASDGRTYDRWTIVENDNHPDHRSLSDGRSPFTRAPLCILCEDVTVRQRLHNMERFRQENLETKCKEMRDKYRTTTVELVLDGQDGEAFERLENLLTWAPEDDECRKHRDAISDRLGKSQPADETLRKMLEDLRLQSKLDGEKIQLLEAENNNLKACSAAAKKEAEAKISSMDKELTRLVEEDRIEFQRLETEKNNLQARLSSMREEAEAKVSALKKDMETLNKEREVQVSFIDEGLRRRKSDAEDKVDSTVMEKEFQVVKRKRLKERMNSLFRGMMPNRLRELEEVQEALAKEDVRASFFKYDELKTATGGFSEQNKLGQGGFGSAYKCCAIR